jgi:predicted  nucleic acid-binding Zn-ribbon protein
VITMTDHHAEAQPGSDDQDAAAVLAAQAAELAALHQELIRSYEKELAFFANLEKRDRQAKAHDNTRLKKIWWLESELRTRRDETVKLQQEVDSLKEEAGRLQSELSRTRAALRNLQNSAMGRVQRSYWKMRQGARR